MASVQSGKVRVPIGKRCWDPSEFRVPKLFAGNHGDSTQARHPATHRGTGDPWVTASARDLATPTPCRNLERENQLLAVPSPSATISDTPQRLVSGYPATSKKGREVLWPPQLGRPPVPDAWTHLP